MKQDTPGKRLVALDGLRGFAILLVFLAHSGIPPHTISQTFMYRLLAVSGGIGVSFLFVLSGFLMAFLYPQPSSAFGFTQKRYTRIFPLFLTISIALLFFRLTPNNVLFQILILLLLALSVHVVWVYGIKRMNMSVKRSLFLSFLCLQILVCVSYFLIAQHIIIFDFSKISSTLNFIFTGITNSTLTYFVGNSFPVLDGVYWSLAAEILFYILYPIICVPIIAHLSVKRRYIKILFLLALMPLFFGIARLFERIPYVAAIHPFYFYHFVGGMTLGYLYRKYNSRVPLFNNSYPKLLSIGSIFVFIGVFLLAHITTPLFNGLLEQILLTIPYTLVVALLLLPETVLTRIFSSKILIYIGTVSYSIYLSHNWVFNVARVILGHSTSILQFVYYIIFSFLFCVLFASILYFLLERPYFIKRTAKEKKVVNFSYKPSNKALFIYVGICVLYISVTFFSYRIGLPYNLLHDPYFKKIAASSNNNKVDSAVLERERLIVSAEERKTWLLLLPFLGLTCFLLFENRWEKSFKASTKLLIR